VSNIVVEDASFAQIAVGVRCTRVIERRAEKTFQLAAVTAIEAAATHETTTALAVLINTTLGCQARVAIHSASVRTKTCETERTIVVAGAVSGTAVAAIVVVDACATRAISINDTRARGVVVFR
jgi:hypothetical protein